MTLSVASLALDELFQILLIFKFQEQKPEAIMSTESPKLVN